MVFQNKQSSNDSTVCSGNAIGIESNKSNCTEDFYGCEYFKIQKDYLLIRMQENKQQNYQVMYLDQLQARLIIKLLLIDWEIV